MLFSASMICCCGKKSLPVTKKTHTSKQFQLLNKKPNIAINRTKLSKHLIVDDSSFNRLVLRRFLNIMGIEVDEVSSAQDALKIIAENGEYGIIWSDFNLGSNGHDDELNGAELTQLLRTQYEYNGSVVVVTGFTDSIVQKKCADSGVNHFLTKPIDRSRVREYTLMYSRST